VLQASEGGRVYLGRSALEIKLRETPAPTSFDAAEATPVPMAFVPTERVSLPAPIEPPSPRLQPFSADRSGQARLDERLDERPERQILLARGTLIGICLTAFACGIVTTVALDRHHFRALEHELRTHETEQAAVATTPPAEPVIEAPAPPAPAPAAAAPDPVVVQLGTPASAPVETSKPAEAPKPAEPSSKAAVDAPPRTATATATARVAAARTPRPAAAPRPAAHHKPATGLAPDAPAPSADWVDPFAE